MKKRMEKLVEALKNIKWLTATSKISLMFLAGINRPINPGHVTKLAKSIEQLGILQPIIVGLIEFITGKPELYIIDGQHKFNALLRNNMPIPYIVIEIKDKKELIETIALLNASSKSWTTQDYVNAWASMVPDYVKLNHYFQVYDIEMSIIAAILAGNSANGGRITKKIKDGSFRIQNEKESVSILDCLTDVLKVVPRMNRYENKYVCSEYVNFMKATKNYNHNKFIESLKKNKKKFVLATQEEGKLIELFYKICVN